MAYTYGQLGIAQRLVSPKMPKRTLLMTLGTHLPLVTSSVVVGY